MANRSTIVTYVSIVDAAAVNEAAAARDALIRQVAAPVLWHDLVEAMLAAGFETFVEVGPGKVLSGLMRRINRKARVLTVADAAGVDLGPVSCLGDDLPDAEVLDLGPPPPPGEGLFYLARFESAAGPGSDGGSARNRDRLPGAGGCAD